MWRFFKVPLSFHQTMEAQHRKGERRLDMQVAPEVELLWDPHDPVQGTLLWQLRIVGEQLFKAIAGAAVPVDRRVLRAIKHSPTT